MRAVSTSKLQAETKKKKKKESVTLSRVDYKSTYQVEIPHLPLYHQLVFYGCLVVFFFFDASFQTTIIFDALRPQMALKHTSEIIRRMLLPSFLRLFGFCHGYNKKTVMLSWRIYMAPHLLQVHGRD